jgi:4-hydroxy-tetrahydrodipicolinate synthase
MSTSQISFEGTYTALVTPFCEDESIDWGAYERLVEEQIAGGVAGVVPCGTTGESPTLSEEEQLELIKRAAAIVGKRAQVIAGTGSSSTRTAIRLAERAAGAGAHGVMVVVPYYSKPTQAGLIAHFVAIAKSVTCPVVAYNIPGRTGVDLACDSLLEIAKQAPNVSATKEATGNVLRGQEIVARSEGRIAVLSGDDALTLAMVAVGAKGVISVTSNVFPKAVSEVTRLALSGDFAMARKANMRLLPVHEAMFVEANPGPVKTALAHRGRMLARMRSPLTTVSAASRASVVRAVEAFQ